MLKVCDPGSLLGVELLWMCQPRAGQASPSTVTCQLPFRQTSISYLSGDFPVPQGVKIAPSSSFLTYCPRVSRLSCSWELSLSIVGRRGKWYLQLWLRSHVPSYPGGGTQFYQSHQDQWLTGVPKKELRCFLQRQRTGQTGRVCPGSFGFLEKRGGKG